MFTVGPDAGLQEPQGKHSLFNTFWKIFGKMISNSWNKAHDNMGNVHYTVSI